jgi:uncharacterized membrane protein SpoIIM required for sporulation
VRALPAQYVVRLPTLYRATLSSLSVAKAISLDKNLVDYLETLCARAYFCVYGTTQPLRDVAGGFFGVRFPAAVRRYRWHLALAAFFLLAGTLVAHMLVSRDAGWFYVFVGEVYAQGRDPTTSTDHLREVLYDRGSGGLGEFTSLLFTHNARIGIAAFALGFVAGIPVYLLLFTNGLILGAFGALYASRGLAPEFWGWILPHGITELLAVVCCGGGGLILAQALVFPGRHSRLRNLALKGRDAGVIAIGAVAMFFVAGILEGFFRQLVQSDFVRYAVAAATALFWWFYFTRAGRNEGAPGAARGTA